MPGVKRSCWRVGSCHAHLFDILERKHTHWQAYNCLLTWPSIVGVTYSKVVHKHVWLHPSGIFLTFPAEQVCLVLYLFRARMCTVPTRVALFTKELMFPVSFRNVKRVSVCWQRHSVKTKMPKKKRKKNANEIKCCGKLQYHYENEQKKTCKVEVDLIRWCTWHSHTSKSRLVCHNMDHILTSVGPCLNIGSAVCHWTCRRL